MPQDENIEQNTKLFHFTAYEEFCMRRAIKDAIQAMQKREGKKRTHMVDLRYYVNSGRVFNNTKKNKQ